MSTRLRFASGTALAFASLLVVLFVLYEVLESPGNQLFGKTLVSGPSNERVVALTYDDGPNPPYTSEILQVLRQEHVHATFFVVGRAVQAYPQIVHLEAAEGNALGNHSWDHGHLLLYDRKAVRQTLERTDAAIFAVTGIHTRIMRPPFGARDWLVLGEARKLGYTPVMWSVPLANDWDYPPPPVIAARVLRYVRDGSIITLHDGNRGILCTRVVSSHVCDRSANVEATRLIVESLKREGFRFVTIPELLERPGGGSPLRRTAARAAE